MKILITGANGLLGQHLVSLLSKDSRYQVIATGKGDNRLPPVPNVEYLQLDITDGLAVNQMILSQQPGAIIHTAAMTQVDECELHEVECWNTNVTATRFLLDAAKQVKAFFIFIGTDFIFDGLKGMYREDDAAGPVNYYGSSKLAAERSVEESGTNYAIVRTCLVYGNVFSGNRSNIISWVKNNLEKKDPIRVVNDQWRTPTYVEDLARGIQLILEKKAAGTWHISGAELLTPYDMAIATAAFLELDQALISQANSINFTQPAKRPAKTGFDISKAKNILGYQPGSLNENLKKMLG